MTTPVVIVGPATVAGPAGGARDLAPLALSCVDDRLAVVDDRVVEVRVLWRDLVAKVLGDEMLSAVRIVVPTWWPAARVDFVVDVLRESCASVTVLRRARLLGDRSATVVEFCADVVVVHEPGGSRTALPCNDGDLDVLDEVERTVVVDVPDGLPAAAESAAAVVRRLRARGVEVSRVGDDEVRVRASADGRPPGARRRRQLMTVAVASVGAAVALGGAALSPRGEPAAMTWVVEGRVAVEVPAHWRVDRITTGPGSARLRVRSPDEQRLAVHLTQVRVSDDETLQRTADALRGALEEQPDGLFVDFVAASRRAGRDAVTYREVRPSGIVEWAVFVDHGVRVAIGCQHPAEVEASIPVCEGAVRSARVVP